MPRVNAIRHLAFEDLGAFEPALEAMGFNIQYLDAGIDDLSDAGGAEIDLLVVLGGPIGAYEEQRYPFLTSEIQLIERRLSAGRPTMGICLGAQLMARSLGARVYPGPAREIGFKALTLTSEGELSALRTFRDRPVLHWHGDTFDLPDGTVRLASTDICENQAFSFGANAIAAQFHPEASGQCFERWLIGHAVELAHANMDVPALRRENKYWAGALPQQAATFLEHWLAEVTPRPETWPRSAFPPSV